jgi:cyclopropane fatty-acyl-phospholipid synthase-like methyltransferase
MPLLSSIAQRRKLDFFFRDVPRDARILEIGCGDGWLRPALAARGFTRYVGIDLRPPADVVGDVNAWRTLGLAPGSFDVIAAFEVVEHVDCFAASRELLAPGGAFFVTTPLPGRDWVMRLLEATGLNQKRTSPHDYLVDLRTVPGFAERRVEIVGGLSQWAVLRKASAAAAAANGASAVQYT